MKKSKIILRWLLSSICFLAATQWAECELITFDDLDYTQVYSDPGPYQGTIYNGYAGLDWTDIYGYSPRSYEPYATAIVSSPNIAFISGTGSLSSTTPFDFVSAYITTPFAVDQSVEVEGFLGPLKLYDDTVTPTASSPTLFSFNMSGVTKVSFSITGGEQPPNDEGDIYPAFTIAALDNVKVNIPTGTPEPSTWILFGSSLLGVGAVVRHRRRVDLILADQP